MKKYAVRFIDIEGCINLTYDTNGNLSLVDMTEILPKLTVIQIEWIWAELIKVIHTQERISKFEWKKVEILELTEGITFEAFWKEYPNKVGRKERCRELWRMLTDAEKYKAFHSIKSYKKWISTQNNMAFVYPETFLNQRRWENEFDEAVAKYYK